MTAHGYNKIKSGIKGTAGWFGSIGMKWPNGQAWTAAISEILSGLLFAAGLFTSAASMIFIALMVVAIATVHWRVGYFIFLPNGGWEYCAAIIAVASGIAIAGPGQIAFDHLVGLSNLCGFLAIPFGIVAALCHLAITFRPVRRSTTS